MPIALKTLGPLHIEDLEPHRFEDLIRQLLYDFRDWNEIEATGRSGGDQGFDIRAWERGGDAEPTSEPEDGQDQPDESGQPGDTRGRQWLVQCKREKAITPAKMARYLTDLPDVETERIYGLLFVAACDFSKTTRDRFITIARQKGFAEARLWGRAEIEDQLFQPKNDHLLFAYCGFSLQVRRRGVKTNIRSVLATKKALKKIAGFQSHILVRDATDKAQEEQESTARQEAMKVWDALPPENKAWLEVTRLVPYDRIVAIDAEGDEYCQQPHIYYVSADGEPFTPYLYDDLSAASMYDHRRIRPVKANRVEVFPRRGKLPHRRW